MLGLVAALALDGEHRFSKQSCDPVRFLKGLGIEGDAHRGVTVRHRFRVAVDPLQPNLRQVHLLAQVCLDALGIKGFGILPGDLGENVTTCSLDLLALARDTRLRIGARTPSRGSPA